MNSSLVLIVIVLALVVASIIWVARLVARDGYGRIPDRMTDPHTRVDASSFYIR